MNFNTLSLISFLFFLFVLTLTKKIRPCPVRAAAGKSFPAILPSRNADAVKFCADKAPEGISLSASAAEAAPKKEKSDEMKIASLLLPSFLGIIICVICICSMTWAWFSAGTSTAPVTLKAAHYEVLTTVTDTNNPELSFDNKGLTPLTAGSYLITLHAGGDASCGYCKVLINGEEYYTDPIYTEQSEGRPASLSFTLNVAEGQTVTLQVIPTWGSFSGEVTIVEGLELPLTE